MQDKLARLSRLTVPERARVMSEALLVCSEEEAQHIAPALIQLALTQPTASHASSARASAKSTLPHASSTSVVSGGVTPRTSDGKPDLHALRARYGLERPTAHATGVGPDADPTQPHSPGFISRLRKWWGRGREADANAALLELARGWAGVPALARDAALAAGAGRWHLVSPKALSDARPRVLQGLALLAAESADPCLAPHVLAAASCSDGAAREAARWSLFALAVMDQSRRWSPAEREAWLDAVQRDAVWRRLLTRGLAYRDRADDSAATNLLRTAIVSALADGVAADVVGEAAVIMGVRPAQLGQGESPARSALAQAVKSLRVPVARERALEWLAGSPAALVSACAVRLARTQGPADHAATLARAALVLRPARGAGLGRVMVRGARRAGRAGGVLELARTALPSAGEVALLPAALVRALPLWSTRLAADAPTRERALEPLLGHADPVVRCAAVLHGPTRLTRDFVFDADARVARCALLRAAASAREGAAPDLTLATRSSHPQVAHLAALHTARHGQAFTQSTGGRIASLRLLATDREASLKTLRWMLSDPREASQAITWIRRLRVVDDCLAALHDAARAASKDPDRLRIAASACMSLGDSNRPVAALHLRSLLEHTEPRVRANAVEALARLARRDVRALPGEVIELKADEHHRVRANATREALLHAAETREQTACADQMSGMLADARPMHRLAGLWLASRTLVGPSRVLLRARWTEMTARVQHMAIHDEDARVRARAAACAAAAAALTRASWIASTSDLAPSDGDWADGETP